MPWHLRRPGRTPHPEGGSVGPEARVAGSSHPNSHPTRGTLTCELRVSPAPRRPHACRRRGQPARPACWYSAATRTRVCCIPEAATYVTGAQLPQRLQERHTTNSCPEPSSLETRPSRVLAFSLLARAAAGDVPRSGAPTPKRVDHTLRRLLSNRSFLDQFVDARSEGTDARCMK